MRKRLPFLLKPAVKDFLWGGSRLNGEFGKNINMSPIAETWECSIHLDGHCIDLPPFYVPRGILV